MTVYPAQPCGEYWISIASSPVMFSLISISADLRINGQALEGEISVCNGLRQSYTMASALFNMFFNLVVETRREQSREDSILYKANRPLMESSSSKHNTAKLTL